MTTPVQETKTAHVGMVGLAVMGSNLALNIERNGYSVAVFNREVERVGEFVRKHEGKRFVGAESWEQFVHSLERPRKIVMLVKAGDPVDWTINQMKPYLEPGDILIDGGNSHYLDTARREQELKKDGIYFIGSGVSGGEKGALEGPSLMPGGDREAYEKIRPVWESIAAKVDDGACVTYIGPGGAGHFVKMVHNGIEYGDMQLIAEGYDLMRRVLGMSAAEMADVFGEWNRGELESYLVEITAKILSVKDPETGQPLVDLVLDKAGQKGTGRWASELALELGVPIPTIDAAVDTRNLSSRKEERADAARTITAPAAAKFEGERGELVDAIRDALYAAKICSYAQGMNLIRAGSDHYDWKIDLGETARIWKGGCIIRARFLGKIKEAYARKPDLASLLLDPDFNARLSQAQSSWRRAITVAVGAGVPVPAMTASLGYFDTYRTAELPTNLTQAQRDFFGSHTYERADRPGAGAVHTEWEELLESQRGSQG
ncbi:MAG: NADP-dependent phosphogluconate dehydrogenase [Acidobacteria bacterium]|nr:NADP-dependent phosphogluconate dehydrogenase [Acidobacteriota bacterium]MCA1641439.1 NADP-dependent phosphogluconate dehydrogenase [Acidobacteriota bacterium]